MRTIQSIERYIGTSAERAGVIPTLLPGHEFFETDTGTWYWFDGSVWVEKSEGAGGYEGRGLLAERPEPNEVPVGFVYWSVDSGSIDVSDGTEWQHLGEV